MKSKKINQQNMAGFIREQFDTNGSVSIDDVALYKYRKTDKNSKYLAQVAICSERKKFEKENDSIIHCENGFYSVIDRRDNTNALVESEKRKIRIIGQMSSFFRILKTLITKFPKIAPVVRQHALEIANYAGKTELNYLRKANIKLLSVKHKKG